MPDWPGQDVRGRRVTVMGLGRFGGGVGAVRFLAERGARVTVTDLRSEAELAASLVQLDGVRLEGLVLGEHREQDFDTADLVVVNPAVRPGSQYVTAARRAGVPVTTEVALFLQHQRGRVAGVTGSNGKSTTAALVHAALNAGGLTARLGGNIGGSLLSEVSAIQPADWTVLELSSFQLHYLQPFRYAPDVAVVTNLGPNHLDWHGTFESYARAKQSLLQFQTAHQTAVLNADDPHVRGWRTRGKRWSFGRTDDGGRGAFETEDGCVLREDGRTLDLPLHDVLRLPGPHNRLNALAAACAATSAGVQVDDVLRGFAAFDGLPHRLQLVGEVAGRRFYDDSLATTPESVLAALDAFDQPVVLLAGGYDKGADLDPLTDAIRHRCKAVALLGQTADGMATRLRDPAHGPPVPKKIARDLHHAFEWAVARSEPGDVVLLSPGCASYDWFRDYEDRAQRFRRLVAEFQQRHHSPRSAPVRLQTA